MVESHEHDDSVSHFSGNREQSKREKAATKLQRGVPLGAKKAITLSPLQIRTFLLHYDDIVRD